MFVWVWWMLYLFGVYVVVIFDGGLIKWKVEGCDVVIGKEKLCYWYFIVWKDIGFICMFDQMKELFDSKGEQIVDVCSVVWFEGCEVELWLGVNLGYMLGVKNLLMDVLFNVDSIYKLKDGLKVVFEVVGVDLIQLIVVICGFGIIVVIVVFVVYLFGNDKVVVYDGLWSEWGVKVDMFKVIGVV